MIEAQDANEVLKAHYVLIKANVWQEPLFPVSLSPSLYLSLSVCVLHLPWLIVDSEKTFPSASPELWASINTSGRQIAFECSIFVAEELKITFACLVVQSYHRGLSV